ncbi:hypothetical protein Y1Q_0008929 [Alligator mississippiensis]|uniref:Uncharacterized protein n=1 Tax=Alligator mississippiensis TaxID=8496 RepID=A0A151NK96_ALLMI|nr:hypothetical protein Y1Q_0008929 [Alligator mississippiensis]
MIQQVKKRKLSKMKTLSFYQLPRKHKGEISQWEGFFGSSITWMSDRTPPRVMVTSASCSAHHCGRPPGEIKKEVNNDNLPRIHPAE